MTIKLQKRVAHAENFSTDLVHEIRNPLASLKSASEILQDSNNSEQRLKLLNILSHDVLRIERLITDYSQMLKDEVALSKEKMKKGAQSRRGILPNACKHHAVASAPNAQRNFDWAPAQYRAHYNKHQSHGFPPPSLARPASRQCHVFDTRRYAPCRVAARCSAAAPAHQSVSSASPSSALGCD